MDRAKTNLADHQERHCLGFGAFVIVAWIAAVVGLGLVGCSESGGSAKREPQTPAEAFYRESQKGPGVGDDECRTAGGTPEKFVPRGPWKVIGVGPVLEMHRGDYCLVYFLLRSKAGPLENYHMRQCCFATLDFEPDRR